jgi:hypothetical protein
MSSYECDLSNGKMNKILGVEIISVMLDWSLVFTAVARTTSGAELHRLLGEMRAVTREPVSLP